MWVKLKRHCPEVEKYHGEELYRCSVTGDMLYPMGNYCELFRGNEDGPYQIQGTITEVLARLKGDINWGECENCGASYPYLRRTKRYCSDNCRTMANRSRAKQ